MNALLPDSGADLLILADRIHTCSPVGPVAALLARNGRVTHVGSEADLRRRARTPRTVDLRGSTITPGLTDAHVHLTEWAFARREVDLSDAESPEHAVSLLAAARRDGASGWIRGRGWNQHRWNGRRPHRSLLDAVIPDRPVALQSHDMHSLWTNTAALAHAGVTADTPDPAGGTIVRDDDGTPSGLLLEWAGKLVTDGIPAPALAAAASAVREAQLELHALGITGVHSFPGVHLTEPDALAVVQHLHAAHALRIRVLQHIARARLADAIATGLRSGDGDEWLRLGALKMFLDGALGSRTAWMLHPYTDGSGRGMQVLDEHEFRQLVALAAAHGIASTVHAIGDAAVCLALDVLANPATRVAALPHRIEHLQCCPVHRLGDAARDSIVCSMQPSHMITDWSIADRCWGTERSRGAFALRSLLDCGTILAFGSDVPVEPVDPRRGLHAAVARQDLGGRPEDGWHAAERIGPYDALLGYTIGPARAAGLAAPAGSLAPGALADFVAWNDDPCSCASMMELRCLATFVGGEQVYST